MPKILALGGFSGGTVANNTTFSGDVIISGTLDVTGVATFTTTVTGSGNIMAGAAFALGFTGRGQWKSSADGLLEAYATDGSTRANIRAGTGTAAACSFQVARVGHGFFDSDASGFGVATNGTSYWRFYEGAADPRLMMSSGAKLSWTSGAIGNTSDTLIYRVGAGIPGTAGATSTGVGGFQPAQSANGATVQILSISESITLNTGGTTTDSSANLLPANSLIIGVTARVTTTITTATSWQLGDPTTAGRFTAANATLTAGTTDYGYTHLTTGIAVAATGWTQTAAAKVRITTVGTPGAGVVRVTIFYISLVAPTS